MDAVTKRFPLGNTQQFFSIPSINRENIKQMEDKSVLVFGCGELSIQLIKSLVLLRVKLVTVICLAGEQARQVRKLTDSLGGNSTKVVTELIDPSKQVKQVVLNSYRHFMLRIPAPCSCCGARLTVCCVQGAALRRDCCCTAGVCSLPGQGWIWLWRAGWVSRI